MLKFYGTNRWLAGPGTRLANITLVIFLLKLSRHHNHSMTPYLQERSLYPPLIHRRPSPLLGIVVVIPCYDEDYLQLSLMSLQKCNRPQCDVEVIVVINHSETALF